MNEFINNIDQYNPICTLICLFIFLVLLGMTYPILIDPRERRSKRIKWVYFVILLFCIIAFYGGDWFHYRDIVNRLSRKRLELYELEDVSTQNHLEIVYWYISYFVKYNYILFRIVVFGGALLILRKAMKVLCINQSTFLAFFVACSLMGFSCSRVCLAQSLFLLGAALIYMASFTGKNMMKKIL